MAHEGVKKQKQSLIKNPKREHAGDSRMSHFAIVLVSFSHWTFSHFLCSFVPASH